MNPQNKNPFRDAARRNGNTRFFDGTKCKHGHVADRYVKSGICVECNRESMKLERTDSVLHQMALTRNRKRYRKKPELFMFYGAKRRAKLCGVPFDITVEDIRIPDVCPVFGFKLVNNEGVTSFNSPSLDRIVPELGYITGNVIVISHKANRAKNNLSISEIRKLYEFYGKIVEPA